MTGRKDGPGRVRAALTGAALACVLSFAGCSQGTDTQITQESAPATVTAVATVAPNGPGSDGEVFFYAQAHTMTSFRTVPFDSLRQIAANICQIFHPTTVGEAKAQFDSIIAVMTDTNTVSVRDAGRMVGLSVGYMCPEEGKWIDQLDK